MLDSLRHDLRDAARALLRSPGFAVVTIAILALGIGANTAIFSLLNTVMLRKLPVRSPSELVYLLSAYPGEPRLPGFGWGTYEQYRDSNDVFSDLIAVSPAPFQVSYDGVEIESTHGQYVSGNFFQALGLHPIAGRLITPQDDALGSVSAAVAVLSWTAWQRRFGADPAITERTIIINRVPVTIAGVAPRGFAGVIAGVTPEFWLPVAAETMLQRPSARERGSLPVGVIGRLKPGVSVEQAQAEMTVLDKPRTEEIARTSGDSLWRQARIDVESAAGGIVAARDQLEGPLLVIMASVGLLLLLACTNISSMLLARGVARQRDLAVRVSLGASPLRLARQILAESLMLSIAGGIAGILAAWWGARLLAGMLTSGRPPRGLPEFELDPSLDLNVLLFTVAVTISTGILFGLVPAWHVFRPASMASLRDGSPAAQTPSRRRWANGLVAVQVAISLMVLSAAALFVRHLSNLRDAGTGFERRSVLLVGVDPSRAAYDPGHLSRLYRELLQRLRTMPGVQSATLSGATPIDGSGASRFVNVDGRAEDPEGRQRVALNWTASGYFETFRTPLIAGRDFTERDEAGPPVAIVNESMARHYFGDANPLGRQFTFEGLSRRYEIVGVVGDAKYTSIHEAPPRTVYLNAFHDAPGRNHKFALRTSVPPLTLAASVRREVHEVLKDVPVAKVITLADQVDAALVTERLIAILSAMFGILAAALAALGLYGLLAFTVSRRIREIGIRIALGATGGDVRGLMLRGTLGLVGAGLLLGVPLAFWSQRLAAGVIPNLPAGTPYPILVAAALLIASAAAAAYLPIRRATRVDPVEVLRHS